MGKDLFVTEIFTQLDPKQIVATEENLRYELLSAPEDSMKMEQLATLLYHKGDYKGAIKLYEKLVNSEEIARKYAGTTTTTTTTRMSILFFFIKN